MTRFALAVCLLAFCAAADVRQGINRLLADEPVKQPSPTPWIVFPDVNQPPAPPSPLPPSPDTVSRLTADQIYVVDAKEPCFLIASPAGLVTVTQDAGPIKIRGRFVGGSGKPETKTFGGAAVFTIEAKASGRVELIVVKVGAKGQADIVRRTVDVDAGAGPQPPPLPPDPLHPLATKFRDAYRADKAAGKAGAQYPQLIADSLSAVASRNGAGAFKNVGEVNAAFKKEVLARAAIPAGQQPALRAEVANALNRPPLNLDGFTAITDALRPQITNLMLEIAGAVKGAAQ